MFSLLFAPVSDTLADRNQKKRAYQEVMVRNSGTSASSTPHEETDPVKVINTILTLEDDPGIASLSDNELRVVRTHILREAIEHFLIAKLVTVIRPGDNTLSEMIDVLERGIQDRLNAEKELTPTSVLLLENLIRIKDPDLKRLEGFYDSAMAGGQMRVSALGGGKSSRVSPQSHSTEITSALVATGSKEPGQSVAAAAVSTATGDDIDVNPSDGDSSFSKTIKTFTQWVTQKWI